MTVVTKIKIDGLGNAGMGVLTELTQVRWETGQKPPLTLRDFEVWKVHHRSAGLVEPSDVGRPKVETGKRLLRKAGWTPAGIDVFCGDVRGCPRSSYKETITFALTDSHASKHESVVKALQVGSPAIAIGLGSHEATVEFFTPGGVAQYCCLHGTDPSWALRQPCQMHRVSTTQLVSREIMKQACRLAVRVAAEYIHASVFPGNRGAHLQIQGVEWFEFFRESTCEGPHDKPFATEEANVLTVADRPGGLSLQELIGQAGTDARYADRPMAWMWHCCRCDRRLNLLHVVYPAAACPVCGAAMEAGFERASGLTGAELQALHGDGPVTLDGLGLADEEVIRLTTADGKLIWLHLEGEPSS
jgi:hypothetical protein